jgi:hypothetical protein
MRLTCLHPCSWKCRDVINSVNERSDATGNDALSKLHLSIFDISDIPTAKDACSTLCEALNCKTRRHKIILTKARTIPSARHVGTQYVYSHLQNHTTPILQAQLWVVNRESWRA